MRSSLFTPYRLGPIELANRLVLAPMTRNRAGADGLPTDSMGTYAQRAGAGLIVTEGTLHMVEGPRTVTEKIRSDWSQPLVVNPAFSLETTPENQQAMLADGRADLVAVGRAFVANPDLVRRLETGTDLNAADQSSFYGGTDAGYIDYPTLDQAA